MMYGFVVVAWLMFPNGSSTPFPSMEACEEARVQILIEKERWWKYQRYNFKQIACLPSGVM